MTTIRNVNPMNIADLVAIDMHVHIGQARAESG
jgi:hypothetical protein